MPITFDEGNDDEDTEVNDVEFEGLGGDLTGYDNDSDFGFEHDDYMRLNTKDLDAFFYNVNEVAQSTMETEGVLNVLETMPPTSTQTVDASNLIDLTSRIPPLNVEIPTSLAFESDLIVTQAS